MRHIVVPVLALALAAAPSTVLLRPDPAQAQSTCAASTPRVGNPVRSAVLNALRPHVEQMAGEDVEFVVQRISVACGWARVIALPQSPGGRGNHYEPVDALLQRTGNVWRLRQMACTEVDCNPAADQYRELYPTVPRSLLFL